MSGYATSVIGCDAECGIERMLSPNETPDGRPVRERVFCSPSAATLLKLAVNRIGQCVMTCPTTACYNGLPIGEKTVVVGGRLDDFGAMDAHLQTTRNAAFLAGFRSWMESFRAKIRLAR